MKKNLLFIFLIVLLMFFYTACEDPYISPLGSLKLVARGNINASGNIQGSSGNFTVSHTITGIYEITWTDETSISASNSIIDVQPIGTTNFNAVWSAFAGGNLRISMYLVSTGNLEAAPFNFTVYQW